MKLNKSKSETKDTICGMTVDEAIALHAERDGKTYYFCSDHCRDTFLSTSSDDYALRTAAQHGQQEHGTKDFVEDIREGLRAKIRDIRSPHIRGPAKKLPKIG